MPDALLQDWVEPGSRSASPRHALHHLDLAIAEEGRVMPAEELLLHSLDRQSAGGRLPISAERREAERT